MNKMIQRNFKNFLLKGFFLLIIGMGFEVSWGQTHFESGDGWGTAGWGSYTAMTQMPSGSGKYGINLSNTGTGNKYFRTANGAGNNRYGPSGTSDVLLAKNGTQNNLEDWNSGNGKANYINVTNTGWTYAFRTNGATSKQMIIFEVQGSISTISTVTQSPVAASVCPGVAVTVTATISGSFSTGQGAYLRYTTDNFSTSTVVELTGSGTTYTANIPAGTNTAGANVKYYVFTSGSGLTITSANADFYTINLNNNSGSNYSYTVNANTSISSQSTATQTVFLGGTSGSFSTPITVTAAGAGLTYQWYSNTSASNSGGTALGTANGAQTSSYTPQATSVGTLYYYCIVTGSCSNATSAISGAFIVNSLNTPTPTTPFSVTNSSVALVWAKNAQAHNVMIVRSTTNSFTAPTNGVAYSVNNTIGSGTVIYNGSGTSTTDNSLLAGTTYYYAFYSENWSYYSSSVTANSTTTGYISAQTGNWTSSSTWNGGVVPPSSADVYIANGHTVTLNIDTVVNSLTINTGGAFTASDNTARTLKISNTTSTSSLTNNGTWSNGTGGSTINFTGTNASVDVVHTVSGTIAFNNIVINKITGSVGNVGVNFGAACSLATGGKLTIGIGGFVNSLSNSAFYSTQSNTTLEFSNTGGYTVGTNDNSWPSSNSPSNINITAGTVTLNSARTASGNLNITGVGTLLLGANLTINGNWTRASSATFTPSTNTVTLSGSSAQTIQITGGGTATMYGLIINNSAGVSLSNSGGNLTNLNVTNSLTLTSGALTTNGNTLTLSNGIAISRATGTISAVPTFSGTSSNTYTAGGVTTDNELQSSVSSISCTNTSGNITLKGGVSLTAAAASNASGGTFVVSSTSSLALGGGFTNAGSLTINGTLQINSGGYILNSAGVTYGSSGSLTYNNGGTYTMSNEWPSTNSPVNITLLASGTRLTIGSSRTINSSGGMTVNPNTAVSVSSGITLTSNNKLTLKSNATGSGSIGNSTGSTITGNVIVERYISGSGRRWRYLGAPVTGQTLASWGSQFYITGPGTPGATVGSLNSNNYATTRSNLLGFNNSAGTPSSVRIYNRTTSGSIENGWANPASHMATTLTPGVGYRVFVRGSITGNYANDTAVIGYFEPGSAPAQSSFTFTQTGGITNTANAGSVAMPISATATGAGNTFDATNDGWNLLANPYPCAYDWVAFWASNTNRTSIGTAIHVFDATANSYKSYSTQAGSGTLTSGLIPSGTGFFVQATGTNAALTFTEAFKTTTNPLALHKTTANNELHIKYYRDSTESDEYILKMIDGATLNKDDYDITKFKNDNLNLSSYGTDSVNLTLSSIPVVTTETRVSMNVEATQKGTYYFNFTNLESFSPAMRIQLLDKFTQKTIDVRKANSYTFVMDSLPHQWGKDRFVLILNDSTFATTTAVKEIANETSASYALYPVPTNDVLNIAYKNNTAKNIHADVFDTKGNRVTGVVFNSLGTDGKSSINVSNLSQGIYFINLSDENGGAIKTMKFVK